MSRKTIGDDTLNQLDESPIDILTTPSVKNGTPAQAPKARSAAKSTQDDAPAHRHAAHAKDRMTVMISQEIIDRAKNAVYWTPGLTMAQLTEEALEAALDKLEKKNGGAFSKRKSELKPGRPLK